MADNFLEYQREAFEARKAKKERERKKRLRKYLEAYKKKVAQQKADQKESAEEWALTRGGRSKNLWVRTSLRHVMGVKNPAGGVILRSMPQKPKFISVFKRKSCVLSVSGGFIVEKKY